MEPGLIIVIGTTPDYVKKIGIAEKEKSLLFVLDHKFESYPELAESENSHSLFTNIENYNETLPGLSKFLSESDNGDPRFVCFDCEALLLTARLAEYFNSPFPSPDSILKARNKFLSGTIWMNNGIPTPKSNLADGLSDSLAFFEEYQKDIVLKPVSGSGSELLFHCSGEEDVFKAVLTLEKQLSKRKDNPLFAQMVNPVSGDSVDPCRVWIVEEFIDGNEFSCDFFLNGDEITLIRETGKIRADEPFGTVLAYTVPSRRPDLITNEKIKKTMSAAARSLGFERGYFMADYIVKDDHIFMIELTPRPGGDSIPELIKASSGSDILKTYMDIMCGNHSNLKDFTEPSGYYTSIHFYSDRNGIIDEIDTDSIVKDPRFRYLEIKKKKGDRVSLPPDDYDSRSIGYGVFFSGMDSPSPAMCRDIQNKIKVSFMD